MRTIKFRSKTPNGEWVYGDLIQSCAHAFIIEHDFDGLMTGRQFEVNTGTIGQFTGLLDKNSKEIYEGDILQHDNFKGVVCWNSNSFFYLNDNKNLEEKICENLGYLLEFEDFVVVGNIHDNPKLLKGE